LPNSGKLGQSSDKTRQSKKREEKKSTAPVGKLTGAFDFSPQRATA
jgi:hypothetical protein